MNLNASATLPNGLGSTGTGWCSVVWTPVWHWHRPSLAFRHLSFLEEGWCKPRPAWEFESEPHSKHRFPASKLCQNWLRHWRGTLYLHQWHSEHRFPVPSSKLCQNWLRHWRGTLCPRAAVHQRCLRPPKGLGTNKTVEATWRPCTHVNTRRVHPG